MKLIKYGADWCSPCKQVKKSLELVNLSGVHLVEIDIDEHPDEASNNSIRGLPTLQLVDMQGNELSRKVGGLSTPQIQQWLDSFK